MMVVKKYTLLFGTACHAGCILRIGLLRGKLSEIILPSRRNDDLAVLIHCHLVGFPLLRSGRYLSDSFDLIFTPARDVDEPVGVEILPTHDTTQDDIDG